MSRALTDENSCVSRRIGTLQRRVRITAVKLLVPAAVVTLSWTPQGGVNDARAEEDAVSPVAPGVKFTAKIKNMHDDGERLSIPLNRSVLIETSQPISTLQSVSPQIAVVQSVSPTQFMISGAAYGETQVIAWSADGGQRIFNVTVELDLVALLEAMRKIDPQSDVQATPIHGSVILTGRVSSAAAAEKMLEIAHLFMPQGEGTMGGVVQNHLQVMGEQQVLLRCAVAEVNRLAVRELGINGFLAGDSFPDAFVVSQVGGGNPIAMDVPAGVNVMQQIPFVTGPVTIGPQTSLTLGFPRVQMEIFLQAMATNSLMHMLAEPNLVAISGETATFLAGGEFPYPVPQGGANNAVTIEWKKFGIELNFTPVVLANQTIRLRVAPTVSALDFSNAVQFQGTVIPALNSRTTQTTVEIGNGQTIAIAGLLNEEVRGVASRIPGIGDVPILGALFRSVEYRKNLTELVILVTPEIVAPLNPDEVPSLPGQLLRDPNDWQLYMLGMIEGEPFADASATPGSALRTRPAPRPIPSAAALPSQPEQLSLHGPWGEATSEDFH